jgi:serine/threonine protein phosphatase PrpC
MILKAQCFWLPKAGNTPDENEDAYFCNQNAGRFALADGASDAYDSRRWARLLVEAFASDDLSFRWWSTDSIEKRVAALSQQWVASIQWDELPWYKVEKARQGAFSTFLGVEFEPTNEILTWGANSEGRWHALAVGDTCLFQIREDKLEAAFPLEKAEDFGLAPPLLGTNRRYNRHSLKHLVKSPHDKTYKPGDIFLLATDALAQWFIGASERGEKPWKKMLQYSTQLEFEQSVDSLRQEQAIRNDDVTLLIVRVKAGEYSEEVEMQKTTMPKTSLRRKKPDIRKQFVPATETAPQQDEVREQAEQVWRILVRLLIIVNMVIFLLLILRILEKL